MNTTHEALAWRYATGSYNTAKKVSDEDINAIVAAGNLMPTAYGLQPFRIITISDEAIKAKLLEASYGQKHLVENSHLVIIATRTDIDEAMITEYAARIETTRGLPAGTVDGYKAMMINDLTNRTEDARTDWAAKQAYLALGGMLIEASVRGIDNHAAEGFLPDVYDEILGLKEKNLKTVVIMGLGYRTEDDDAQHYGKVRVAPNDMHITL
ncbi:hypothetical protein A3C87_02935 [Candidatus Kaiserbacteria bacterium RIFCSPHIGHO2_02_FULL_49_34]|uniref:Nitroreductase domain-containing protein n=1 Tax=Candidatus Kaiserbacteria bacterium RIFCSPHIGHO2_02_FULL_49_34 TaxID=1798491 RepID=A0A1F6DI65_9BACT|nr:MAG: hypothetical protein A3C87_02935 [Candidatus Kaiserbacteria bacterium RIFCSPHIGHO2_02_FULL_49_34]